MSKYSKDMEETYKDVGSIKKATKELIEKGGKIALEKYYESKSLEKLKKDRGIK